MVECVHGAKHDRSFERHLLLVRGVGWSRRLFVFWKWWLHTGSLLTNSEKNRALTISVLSKRDTLYHTTNLKPLRSNYFRRSRPCTNFITQYARSFGAAWQMTHKSCTQGNIRHPWQWRSECWNKNKNIVINLTKPCVALSHTIATMAMFDIPAQRHAWTYPGWQWCCQWTWCSSSSPTKE